MEYFNETQREVSFGQAAGDVIVGFEFGHQGDELLDMKGEITAVLAIYEELEGYKGPKCVVKGPQEQGMMLLILNLATRGTSY